MLKYLKVLGILGIGIFTNNVFAEYRVFQYDVKSKYELPWEKKSYIVTSTLDPVSYVSYHGGDEAISVNLIQTWTCKGNTAGRDYCNSPYERSVASEGASTP